MISNSYCEEKRPARNCPKVYKKDRNPLKKIRITHPREKKTSLKKNKEENKRTTNRVRNYSDKKT